MTTSQTDKIKLYARVVIPALGRDPHECYGDVVKIRYDDRGEAIYTVRMDNPHATADGIFYAREFELIVLS